MLSGYTQGNCQSTNLISNSFCLILFWFPIYGVFHDFFFFHFFFNKKLTELEILNLIVGGFPNTFRGIVRVQDGPLIITAEIFFGLRDMAFPDFLVSSKNLLLKTTKNFQPFGGMLSFSTEILNRLMGCCQDINSGSKSTLLVFRAQISLVFEIWRSYGLFI